MMSNIPAGTDVFALIQKLPPAVLSQISTTIDQKFATLGNSMIVQMATGAVKNEYMALGMQTNNLQTNYILRIGLLMLLLTLLSGACTIAVGYLSARTAAGLARDLRRNVFERVENFSSTEFDKFSTASLITRSTNDITQIQMVVIMMMRMFIYAPIIGIGGTIRAIGKSPNMWWIIALAVVIMFGMIMAVFSVALPKFKAIQSLIDRLNLVLRENLSGMMVIRSFNMQKFEEDRFDTANKNLTNTLLFVNRIMVLMMPFMMMIMNGVVVLIIWVGSHQVAARHHPGGRHDGFHAICPADIVRLHDALDDVHHPAACLGFRRPHFGSAGNRAAHPRPAGTQAVPRTLQGDDRIPGCQFPLPGR